MITHQQLLQTGPIERGIIWGLGRIGEPVASCSPLAVEAIAAATAEHADPATRQTAAWALGQIQGRQARGGGQMDFQELIRARYSARAYQSDPVPEDRLQKVLEAARLAPTADNRQPFQIVVIKTAGRQQQLKRIYNKDWFVQAPLIVAACGVPSQNWVRKQDGKNYNDVDVAIVMDHIILAAADLGLGTCWIAAFDPVAAREILQLPTGVEPVAFTPLGYPADQPRQKKRKALGELVRYETW
jgi:nitroreductase